MALIALHQIKKLLTVKETIITVKRQPTEWEKIFVNYSSDRISISNPEYIKNSKIKHELGVVILACNLSYLRDRELEDLCQEQSR
jgi:hypothetical protein